MGLQRQRWNTGTVPLVGAGAVLFSPISAEA